MASTVGSSKALKGSHVAPRLVARSLVPRHEHTRRPQSPVRQSLPGPRCARGRVELLQSVPSSSSSRRMTALALLHGRSVRMARSAQKRRRSRSVTVLHSAWDEPANRDPLLPPPASQVCSNLGPQGISGIVRHGVGANQGPYSVLCEVRNRRRRRRAERCTPTPLVLLLLFTLFLTATAATSSVLVQTVADPA